MWLTAIALGMQMMGEEKSASAQSGAYRRSADQADINARKSRAEAQVEAEMRVLQARKIMGQQRTDFAAAGISGGSPFAVMSESLVNAEMDRLSVILGGNIRSENFKAEARGLRSAANDAKQGTMLGAMGL